MQMIGRVEITKGFETWIEMSRKTRPMLEEAGMRLIWAGCDPEEKHVYAVLEVSDPEAAMAFGKREDVAALRAEAGVLVETGTNLSAISKSFMPE